MASNSGEINKIKGLFKNKYVSNEQTIVQEINRDCKGRELIMKREVIGHSSLEYIIYRFDPDEIDLFPYFEEVKGLRKICDYLIFSEDKGRLFIFIVELKKRSGSPLVQLELSECFVNFILKRAEKIGITINKEVHIRKIGLKDSQSSNKQKTTYYKDMQYDNNRYILLQAKCPIRLALLMDLSLS